MARISCKSNDTICKTLGYYLQIRGTRQCDHVMKLINSAYAESTNVDGEALARSCTAGLKEVLMQQSDVPLLSRTWEDLDSAWVA